MIKNKERIVLIDMLRGIASLGVCVFHINQHIFDSAPTSLIRSLFLGVGVVGGLGVDMFFAISGFIIPHSLYLAKYNIKKFPNFILKRIVRLDPPYILSIILVFLLIYFRLLRHGGDFVIDPIQALLHLGYLSSVFGYNWFNPVYWSLSVEFAYYLSIGLLFPLITSKNRFIKNILFVLFIAINLFFVSQSWITPDIRFTFVMVLSFLIGIVLYQYKTLGILSQREFFIKLGIITLCKAVFFLIIVKDTLYLLENLSYIVAFFYITLLGTLTAISILFIKKERRVLVFLGKISYSLYLTHYIISKFITEILVARGMIGNDLARIMACFFILGVCLLFAYCFYLLIEKPSQRWASKIVYSSSK